MFIIVLHKSYLFTGNFIWNPSDNYVRHTLQICLVLFTHAVRIHLTVRFTLHSIKFKFISAVVLFVKYDDTIPAVISNIRNIFHAWRV